MMCAVFENYASGEKSLVLRNTDCSSCVALCYTFLPSPLFCKIVQHETNNPKSYVSP